MSVELTIETFEETIVLELQDHVPAVLTIDHIPELRDELDSKVDKVEGYSLVADDEIGKLSTVQENATANRDDSENADKEHSHTTAQVDGLDDAIYDKSENLFRYDNTDLFPDANLPVRLILANGATTDYPTGSYQTATNRGVNFNHHFGGARNYRVFLSTGKFLTKRKTEAVIYPDAAPKAGIGESVGFGYIDQTGRRVSYMLSDSGVVRKITDNVTVNITGIISTFNANDKLVFSVKNGYLTITKNDLFIHRVTLADDEFKGELIVGQVGNLGFSFSLVEESDPIREYVDSETANLPVAFYQFERLSLTGRPQFNVFTKINGNTYIGFYLRNIYDMRELQYVDYWHIDSAKIYTYMDGSMYDSGVYALAQGESECVFRRNSSKDDFTGGIHGDEIIDSVQFFADGVIVDISNDIPLTKCNDFYYLARSTMHETSEGGVVIAGHPIECYHIKKTEFNNSGYTTFNRLTWVKEGVISLWYHGISCISKNAASNVYTDSLFTSQAMTGSNIELFKSEGHREMIGWGADYSCSVTSELIKPSLDDSACNIFVWDRPSDSKYYRSKSGGTTFAGDVWESVMSVKFNKTVT